MGKIEIEHRDYNRVAKETKVWLYKDNDIVALALSKNATSTGMFIKTNPLLFPKNSILHVAIDIDNAAKRSVIPATVVHRSLDGIGIEFNLD